MKLSEVLSGPEKLCRFVFATANADPAYDGHSGSVGWESPHAVRFCLRGAAFKAAGLDRATGFDPWRPNPVDERLKQAFARAYPDSVGKNIEPAGFVNRNGTTFDDVKLIIEAYDQLLKEEESLKATV